LRAINVIDLSILENETSHLHIKESMVISLTANIFS